MKPVFRERDAVKLVGKHIRIDRNGHIWRASTGRRAESSDGWGYYMFSFKKTTIRSHRLVWQWRRGDIPAGMEINHKNGVKTDNRMSNLELVTPGDNLRHDFRVLKSRSHHGIKHHAAVFSESDVSTIRRLATTGATLMWIANEFGVSKGAVCGVVYGRTWKHIL